MIYGIGDFSILESFISCTYLCIGMCSQIVKIIKREVQQGSLNQNSVWFTYYLETSNLKSFSTKVEENISNLDF